MIVRNINSITSVVCSTKDFIKIKKLFSINKNCYSSSPNFDIKKEDLPDPDIDLDSKDLFSPKCNGLKPFKSNELIVAKIFDKSKKYENQSCRLFKLEQNGIFRTKLIDIFHEHIIYKSLINQRVTFEVASRIVDFRRPSLYEYISLKEQQAVSSHFSIVTLVPLLLEIGKNSKVLECGTGSGSMSLFLSEHLGNNGCLHTFDINKLKSQKAKKSFIEWKNSYDLWAGEKWTDNVKFGFMDFNGDNRWADQMPEFYDAIYLDMADLSQGIQQAYKMIKKDGVLVVNAMHLTQIISCLNAILNKKIAFQLELVMEPANRFWELRKVKQNDSPLAWTSRLEDRFSEKYKRGGLYFNYWQGFLAKFRKLK